MLEDQDEHTVGREDRGEVHQDRLQRQEDRLEEHHQDDEREQQHGADHEREAVVELVAEVHELGGGAADVRLVLAQPGEARDDQLADVVHELLLAVVVRPEARHDVEHRRVVAAVEVHERLGELPQPDQREGGLVRGEHPQRPDFRLLVAGVSGAVDAVALHDGLRARLQRDRRVEGPFLDPSVGARHHHLRRREDRQGARLDHDQLGARVEMAREPRAGLRARQVELDVGLAPREVRAEPAADHVARDALERVGRRLAVQPGGLLLDARAHVEDDGDDHLGRLVGAAA